MAIEKAHIPFHKTADLRHVLCEEDSTPETREDFADIFELVQAHVLTIVPEKRDLTLEALRTTYGTGIEIFTAQRRGRIHAYVIFGGVEDAYFFVGSFPLLPKNRLEVVDGEEMRLLAERCA